MKTNIALVSLLSALAPLASACVAADPVDVMPAESMLLGELGAPSEDAAKAPVIQAKSSAPADTLLFPREATPFGQSYEDWASAWWQWGLAIPVDENPMRGGDCNVDQSGNVFFLAGTNGGGDVRTCEIPAGKGIFFPIVNLVMASCPEVANESYTCEVATSEDELHSVASWYMENAERTFTLEIDGVAIEGLDAYRAHSDTFAATAPPEGEEGIMTTCGGQIRENSCGVPAGSDRNAVADGYWAMLRPLPPGEHKIHFTANMVYPTFSFALDVEYDIVVVP
jgi:hypothetical protein